MGAVGSGAQALALPDLGLVRRRRGDAGAVVARERGGGGGLQRGAGRAARRSAPPRRARGALATPRPVPRGGRLVLGAWPRSPCWRGSARPRCSAMSRRASPTRSPWRSSRIAGRCRGAAREHARRGGQGAGGSADWVEIDVQEIADGTVIVAHDSDFMKQAGVPLKVWEATPEDLARIDIGSWFDPSLCRSAPPDAARGAADGEGARAGPDRAQILRP